VQGSHPHPRPQSVAAAKAYGDADCGPGATLERVLVADGLPFYERFYAGGSRSVRTFRDNALGPCEYVSAYDDCRPTGGALKTVGGLELSMPRLFAGNGTRIALFADAGNVFDGLGGFDSGELRASAGLSVLWRSPMGPISISYGVPLRKQAGDDVERLQFSFGGQF
jgi:outer membrane protein insertion porin family